MLGVRIIRCPEERGLGLLELAIVLPFLFLFFAVVIELGMLFIKYNRLTAIAYEGARYGSLLNGLEDGWINSDKPVHGAIANRINNLLASEGLVPKGTETVVIRTFLVTCPPSDPTPDFPTEMLGLKDFLYVRISLSYDPIFFSLTGAQQITVTSSMTSPYLYTSECS